MNEKNISDEISWVDRVHKRYKEVGTLIPHRQRKLYEKIRDEWVAGRTVVDVGCSLGIGSNILSHEARFVWGLDINEEAIDFAKRMFKRPNLDFMVADIENPPNREISKFEVVVMIETLEHLQNPEKGLREIKTFFKEGSLGFITVPNHANKKVRENEKKHGLHLGHWTAGQFYELMIKHFRSVTMYSVDKLESWKQSETVDGNSQDYLIVAKLEGVK